MEPKIFLSTLSLRRATAAGPVDVSGVEISIHALLAESDWATAFHFRSRRQFLSTLSLRRATQAATWSTTWTRISIHALLAESDDPADSDFAKLGLFLSTLSLRRATSWQYIFFHPPTDFYPRSPCGERPRIARSTSSRPWNFYPRSPCGERPICWPRSVTQRRNFYPRSPCGERRRQADRVQHHRHFYPRSPCGERHFVVQHLLQLRIISIHALLAESDSILRGWEGLFPLFLSTLSLRRATCVL